MDAADVWVAKDAETETIRAREIAAADLDYDGNVTARLAGGGAALVTLVRGRTRHDEPGPGDFIVNCSGLSPSCPIPRGAHLARAAHDESRGWMWVSESL